MSDGNWNGKEIEPFTNKDIFSRRKHDEIRQAVNALLNPKIQRGGSDAIKISDRNVTYQIKRNASSSSSSAMHPFKLYRVASGMADADKNSTCYAVRSGHIELRPRWYPLSGLSVAQSAATFAYYDYIGGQLGDDIEDDSETSGFGFSGTYFVLESINGITSEVVTSVDYGCYYAFWLEVNDNTPNATPTVSVQCRRFSAYGSSGSYPTKPFPDPVWNGGSLGAGTTYNTLSKEVLPLAILQLVPATSPIITDNSGIGIVATPPNGLIAQFQTTNFVNRFDYSGTRFLGEFDNSQYRMYYPGDEVLYYGGGSDYTFVGRYVATLVGRNAAGMITPFDNTAGFVYTANINRPSVTNPP